MSESFEFPPRLTVERQSVLHLFTGDTFYSSKDAALREAVLNAIDAIARRRAVEPSVKPAITVRFITDPLSIEISDNGTGMTRIELAQFFAKVGASASKMMVSNPSAPKMIGEFGIGVMSYFLAGENFEVQTLSDEEPAVALRFSRRMIDEEIPAEMIPAQRSERGTTLTIFVSTRAIFDLLLAKYSHWMRNVDGLQGIGPDGAAIDQGGLSREVMPVQAPLPDWILESSLGPPLDSEAWQTFDGNAHVDVLYGGVFVERVMVPQLWGVEGSIFVDPKHFRPKLNREGFVGDGLKSELQPFLRAIHPLVLARAAERLPEILANASVWTEARAATIWMAMPRSGEYAPAADAWDKVFRARKVIRQLLSSGQEAYVSVDDLVTAKHKEIYLVPQNLGSQSPVIRAAVRLLRDEGAAVIAGVERDGGFLQSAPLHFGSTESMLVSRFSEELPPLRPVQNEADTVLRREALVDLCHAPFRIRIVKVGPEASAVLVAGSEIWVNAAVEPGRAVARHVCSHPYGLSSFLAACLAHAPDQIAAVASLFRGHPEECFSIGPVRRQLIEAKLG
jgi:hypothetical protein